MPKKAKVCAFDLKGLVGIAVRNAGNHAAKPAARWAHVMRTFAVGSGTAHALCRSYDVDPEEVRGTWPPCPHCGDGGR